MRLRNILFSVAVLTAVAAGGYWYQQGGLLPEVTLAPVTRGPAAQIVYATGTVEPVNWARVAPVTQGRVVAILARDGQPVTTGQALARLDDREARARLGELEARERFWRDEVARTATLQERGYATREARERAQMEYLSLQAGIAAARQRVVDLTVVSPMDGVVLRQDGEIGEVADQRTTLFWIGQPTPLRITAEIDEEEIPSVAAGQAVLIKADAFPGDTQHGTIGEITPRGDPVNRSFRVRVVLPDDTRLRIGMTTELNVVVRENRNAVLVPAGAVVAGHVLVVESGVVRRRAVRIGIQGRQMTEILQGLMPGEHVIAAPGGLTEGSRVRIAEPNGRRS